jgi:hypothetical protein
VTRAQLLHRHKFVCKAHLPFETKEAAHARLRELLTRPELKDKHLMTVFTCLACEKFHCGHEPEWRRR